MHPNEHDATDEASRDTHILAVADHGVNPADMPTMLAPAPAPIPVPTPTPAPDGATKGSSRLGWRDLFVWCCLPALIVLLARILLVGVYVIPSGSMLDTIEIGDRVITSKLSPKLVPLKRGDIIVFHDPANWLQGEQSTPLQGDFLIKRLIGLPGDVVECKGAGEPVTINGEPIDESAYIRPGVEPSSFPFRVTVSEGHLFVLGDNRASSADSRYHQDDGELGLVPIDDVVGVAIARFWPLTRIGLLDAHHEVFAQVPEPSGAQAS